MVMPRPQKAVSPSSVREIHLPAPNGGINTLNAGSAMPVTDCVSLYNMIAAEYGLRARLGYREWCTGLGDGAGNLGEVRSILPFTGSADNGANDRLFATTSTGIWDVTDSGTVSSGAWATAHAYSVGTLVNTGGGLFICKTAGTSSAVASSMPDPWVNTTGYLVGDRVLNDDGSVYICTVAGTSAGSGGPTGTNMAITDGTVTWAYQSADTDVTDGTVVWVYTPDNAEPELVWEFDSDAGRAGHGVCHVHVTAAGHFLLYWDEVNGLHVYADASASGGAADTWAAVAMGGGADEISGIDPANLVFGTVFKGRVFHVEANTAKLWYMDTGAIFGTANALDIGFKLKAGGSLVGCWNWTYDGGAGVDDALVVASRGGDICIYKGTDPSSVNSFGLDGVWGVGSLPAGREVATDFGGDLLFITRSGVIALSKLVLGRTGVSDQYETSKIANLFTQAMLTRATIAGWTARLHPEEGALIVTVPEAEGAATTQLVMALNTKSWSRYRDLPIYSSNVFDGKFYFGTVDGRVCINDGYRDGITLADPATWTAIEYAGLSSFQNLGSPSKKQAQYLRGYFLADSDTPSFSLEARFDFDFGEVAPVTPGTPSGSLWGTAVWGVSKWGGDYAPSMIQFPAAGFGTNMAIAWRGAAQGRTILVGFDAGFTQGGFS